MKCIYCGNGKSKVIDTRDSCEKIRRRRECKDCGRRFTTYETAESFDITVTKRDGEDEKFDEEKVRSGIENATKNTKVEEDEIEEMIEEVKEKIRGEKEVSAEHIGDLVMEALKKRNQVAYIRFASVYEKFEDVESFQKEVEQLKEAEK
ncbi:transcriptional regulator NrdR [Candidatus Nanosalina sp. VS9-1]|uniref:transcriptional regulator NrdR n=1 Tax=Candidatus Nanosalina sp. VS9-1 TaxID=3388566 RepID=UPI0039E0C34E